MFHFVGKQNGLIIVVGELGDDCLGLDVSNIGIVALFCDNVEIVLGDLIVPRGVEIFVQDRLGAGGCCLCLAEGFCFTGIDAAC